MKALIWPAGDENDGTSNYRLRFPATALLNEGADISFDTVGPNCVWDRSWAGHEHPTPDVRLLGLKDRPDADIVVIQRPGRRWWADLIPHLQAEGIRVVVDVDDLFSKIDPGNQAREQFDPRYRPEMNYEWVDLACERADVVTCTTQALKAVYGHGHGHVLPNLVPEWYLSLDTLKRPHTVGWTGTVGTHPHDLQATRGAVGQVLKEHYWHFHHIGTGYGVKEALQLPEDPTFSGWVSFDQYAYNMAQIEVGIVPLADTPFNVAKSCLKMIEFAALGVPVVATGTPDNLRMHNLGIGMSVKNPSHWFRRLNAVVKDGNLRLELAEKGRLTMSDHTYEKQCWRWADVWGLEKGKP